MCVCSWLPVPGGSCNYAIPIATSSPQESPPHMCRIICEGEISRVFLGKGKKSIDLESVIAQVNFSECLHFIF
jgi:hypothetical protein